MLFANAWRAAIISSALVASALPVAAFGIGLQPTTVEMQIEPGERHRQVIHLGNVHTEDTIALTLGLADWSLDEAGQIELMPPGEGEGSASDWVRFSPAFVTLQPGETEQIIVDMAAPIRVSRAGDHRFALIASTILPEERSGQSGVWKKYQLASLFYLTLGEGESTPSVRGASLSTAPNGQAQVDLAFENTGNAHARLRGQMTVKGDGADPIFVPLNNIVVLDGATRT
ncbi:MAG: hypothetical protein AAGF20_02530, partial [Pseudomonadota bacterium]